MFWFWCGIAQARGVRARRLLNDRRDIVTSSIGTRRQSVLYGARARKESVSLYNRVPNEYLFMAARALQLCAVLAIGFYLAPATREYTAVAAEVPVRPGRTPTWRMS